MNDVSVSEPIAFDSYHIKLDMSSDGIDRSIDSGYPVLYSNQTKSTGGYNTRATQNMPFEIITPLVQNLTVQGTSLSAEVRTITSQSFSASIWIHLLRIIRTCSNHIVCMMTCKNIYLL